MYFDDRIIARQSAGAGGLCVLAHADTVQLRDGSTVQLHAVQANGLPMLTHRALATSTGHLQLADAQAQVATAQGAHPGAQQGVQRPHGCCPGLRARVQTPARADAVRSCMPKVSSATKMAAVVLPARQVSVPRWLLRSV